MQSLKGEYSRRSAFVVVADGDGLRSALSVLRAAGYGVKPIGQGDVNGRRLILINGDALPAECEVGMKLVDVEMVTETYGRQSMVKVAGIVVLRDMTIDDFVHA